MKKYFIFLLLLIAAYFLGRSSATNSLPAPDEKVKITRSKQTQLINPLLDCEIYKPNEPRIAPIQKEVTDYLTQNRSQYQTVSVYFRDLNNGPWFGLNEKDKFAPMSLLKVPVMIAYLKLAEKDEVFLEQKLPYTGSHFLQENITPNLQLKEGNLYSLDELIRRMIAFSDNVSFEMLVNHIDPKNIQNVHDELGVVYPNQSTPDDYITVKNYASLFRILYNATFLNRQMSEKALRYLLNSDFKEGIRAGIPSDVRAALKFGVKDDPQIEGLKQIHDCGVVYASQKPYLLCIMTKGENKELLIPIIRDISKIVYEEYTSE